MLRKLILFIRCEGLAELGTFEVSYPSPDKFIVAQHARAILHRHKLILPKYFLLNYRFSCKFGLHRLVLS